MADIQIATLDQYRAWVRNNGTYETPRKDFACWNSEVTQRLNYDLSKPWETFEVDVNQSLDSLEEAVRGNLASSRRQMLGMFLHDVPFRQ